MAAELKRSMGIDVQLVVGDPGEYTVWVGDTKVSEKKWMFPSEQDVLAAVRAALG